jgi:2-phospho-L-lactate guanylyltransferase
VHSTLSPVRWAVVVPLKASARGKSRIDVDPVLRRRLARAMAVDTATAASAAAGVGAVLVVVEDPADAEQLDAISGLRVHLTRTRELNGAIADGLAALPGGFTGPVAVLPGDLPSLTADELAGALAAARPHLLAVVADRQGTGTTLLTAASRVALRPQYGAGSLRRHLAAGAVPIELPVDSGLRRDVDIAADLRGVTGPSTAAVLAETCCGSGAGWPGLCAARPAG